MQVTARIIRLSWGIRVEGANQLRQQFVPNQVEDLPVTMKATDRDTTEGVEMTPLFRIRLDMAAVVREIA
jgi:hypothetical protein